MASFFRSVGVVVVSIVALRGIDYAIGKAVKAYNKE